MTVGALERWHVGPWTTLGTLPGEPLQPGVRRTPDELNFDVVGLARILGRRLSGRGELQVRLWQNELRPTHTRRCGVHTLADPDNSRLLAETARAAFDWLAARGYRYVTFPGPMSVEFGSYPEAVELAEIFYPEAADEVRRLGRRAVPFDVLGINPPRDLAFKVLAA